jgi:hypothetical protein
MSNLQSPITVSGSVPPRADTVKNEGKGQLAAERWCDACGAVEDVSIADSMLPGVDLRLCGECLRTLSGEEIERLASEIALRGVPWS